MVELSLLELGMVKPYSRVELYFIESHLIIQGPGSGFIHTYYNALTDIVYYLQNRLTRHQRQ